MGRILIPLRPSNHGSLKGALIPSFLASFCHDAELVSHSTSTQNTLLENLGWAANRLCLLANISPNLNSVQDKAVKPKGAHLFTNSNQNTVHHAGGARYGSRYGTISLPKYKIPTEARLSSTFSIQFKLMSSQGVEADTAYQIIHDELSLDGQPLLNLASFVQTWMPPIVDKLMVENISKNLIDQDEYPITQDIHTRCEYF